MRPTRHSFRWNLVTAVILAIIAGCGRDRGQDTESRYLYVWAGDADNRPGDTDFLAVIDVDTASPTYAQVVATAPISAVHTMPHHTEPTVPRDGKFLFANGFMANRTYLFDVSDPLAPRMVKSIDSVPGFRSPHSYVRLEDGRVLATLQFGNGSEPGDPGGLALFSRNGDILQTASAADSSMPGAAIRTYSLAALESLDRVITTSSAMDTERTADVVQVWRLEDLTLLKTLAVPPSTADSAGHFPFEVRWLPDNRAFLSTWNCGFYLLSGLDRATPSIERILALDHPRNTGCGVPTLVGHHWIMPISNAQQYMTLDIADPRRPRIASVLRADSGFTPHWSIADPHGRRIAFTSEGPRPGVMLGRFDSTTGLLTWDENFREDGKPRGVSFERTSWPHGDTGPAHPHAAVFGPGPRKR
jgi:hypothetical protein